MHAEIQRAQSKDFAKNNRAVRRILEQARRLARSGQYSDWTSVITKLELEEGFEHARRRFEEAAFRSQLNQLCAMAQAEGARPRPVPARNMSHAATSS